MTVSSSPQVLTQEVFREFNRYCKKFLKELQVTFPNLTVLKFMYGSFYILKKLNKKTPHKIFNNLVVTPYEKQLRARDSDFFLRPEFDIQFWTSWITDLKATFAECDEQDRKAIWDHLNVLMVLNKRCLEYRKKNVAEDSGDETPYDNGMIVKT